ncbi:large subunit GTPase 1 homolog isoform X2 [Stylophora pistillata]|uniref:large subunit GTPase 1 homolog isoform X2 n=1 Tax=Stylophora pistillata TaxID=50429 RepID=UPI000C045DB2|nr:large subunit GTPase 1 homolog isoform X2 [Stylophora pistillata]
MILFQFFLMKMGKKNQNALGKSIIKHSAKSRGNIKHANSWLHSSEVDNEAGPNLQSITEQSALDDFLATAELAGTEFAAEKLNTTIVTPGSNLGLLSSETAAAIKQAQRENQHFLRIPRRPNWNEHMTAEELDQLEKESFLEWRRHLAQLQEKEYILLTPFERNLGFWRQLWRVIERSDVVVQIVDARNPLLFRCEDLENYVKEVYPKKCNLLLVNKADLLSPEQRYSWSRYFRNVGLPVAFWSAQQENERLSVLNAASEEEEEEENSEQDEEKIEGVEDNELEEYEEQSATLWSKLSQMTFENDDQQDTLQDPSAVPRTDKVSLTSHDNLSEDKCEYLMLSSQSTIDTDLKHLGSNVQDKGDSSLYSCQSDLCLDAEQEKQPSVNAKTESVSGHDSVSEISSMKGLKELKTTDDSIDPSVENASEVTDQSNADVESFDDEFSAKLLTRDELLALFKILHMKKIQETVGDSHSILTTVGLVGYPNVGKSSTINTLLNDKKVPVSATPGRTKHFQTLFVNDEVLLCDCPGLVFPSFVSTKADMILNGILPIDQMRDHVPAVSLLCQRIPRGVLEIVYGINIALPQEGEDPNRAPYAEELLYAYGYTRGFMTSHGIPDESRSARYVLKDYVKGKLLYCIAPPGQHESEFQKIGYKLQSVADIEWKDKQAKQRALKQRMRRRN